MDVDDEEIAVGSVSSAPAPSPGPSSAVQAVQSNHIKNIKICNFNSFDGMVTIFGIQKKNNLISNLDTDRRGMAIAIFFALGATTHELQVTDLLDLKADRNEDMYVELEFDMPGVSARRQLRTYPRVETFYFGAVPCANLVDYLNQLRTIGYDLRRQFHFYDAINRKMFWSQITSEQDELIATLTDPSAAIRQYKKINDDIIEMKRILDHRKKCSENYDKVIKMYKTVLPGSSNDYDNFFQRYVFSLLKRQEKERIEKKKQLESVQVELTKLEKEIDASRILINSHNGSRNTKVRRNEDLLEDIRAKRFNYHENFLFNTMEVFWSDERGADLTARISDAASLVTDLERYAAAAQSNINSMEAANNTNQKINLISEDALMKLYPIFHSSDELEMDKFELNVISKDFERNTLKNDLNMAHYANNFLPNRSIQSFEEDINAVLREFIDAIKSYFHPTTFLIPFDDLKLEVLQSMITKSDGFLLTQVVLPSSEHENLVNNILFDHKYTVVLYKDNTDAVYEKLNKEHPGWFLDLKFLVLQNLQNRGAYIAPTDHWLNCCVFKMDHYNYAVKDKLFNHLGEQLNIFCVDRTEDVQKEFEENSKKYVASKNGELIYARNGMGIDVLMYFKPGEKINRMYIAEACQRLKHAHIQLVGLTSKFFETTKQVSSTTAAENELEKVDEELKILNDGLNERKDKRIHQMEDLRQRINQSYTVADVQQYNSDAEKIRLDNLNKRIAEVRNEINQFQGELLRSRGKGTLSRFLEIKGEYDRNKKEIITHDENIKNYEKEIKAAEKRMPQLDVKVDRLLRDIKNLKYKTLGTIMIGNRGGCVWRDIPIGTYVGEMEISTTFEDMSITYDKVCGKKDWYTDKALAEFGLKLQGVEKLNEELNDLYRRRDELTETVETERTEFNTQMNRELNRAGLAIFPEILPPPIFIFKFNWEVHTDILEMIFLQVNGQEFRLDFFDRHYLAVMQWLVFAAFHLHSSAPFVFIDLTDVKKEVIKHIFGIIDYISARSQLFINSSHVHHLHFANLQWAVNKKAEIQQHPLTSIEILKYDTNDVNAGYSVPPEVYERTGHVVLRKIIDTQADSYWYAQNMEGHTVEEDVQMEEGDRDSAQNRSNEDNNQDVTSSENIRNPDANVISNGVAVPQDIEHRVEDIQTEDVQMEEVNRDSAQNRSNEDNNQDVTSSENIPNPDANVISNRDDVPQDIEHTVEDIQTEDVQMEEGDRDSASESIPNPDTNVIEEVDI